MVRGEAEDTDTGRRNAALLHRHRVRGRDRDR